MFLYGTGDRTADFFIKGFQAESLFQRKCLDELIIQLLLFLGNKSPETGKAIYGTADEVEGKKSQKCHEPPGFIHIVKAEKAHEFIGGGLEGTQIHVGKFFLRDNSAND